MNPKWLGLVCFVAMVGCGERTPSPAPQPPVVALPAAPVVPRDDAEDRDRDLARRTRQAVRDRPALQMLPWRHGGIEIEMQDVTTDGRVVLLIRTPMSASAARQAYRAFLRRAGDPGRAYAITFRTAR